MKQTKLYNEFFFTEYRYHSFRQGSLGTPSARHFIALMKSGTAEIKSEDKTLVINTGDIFYIPKGIKYYSYWYPSPDICFLSIGFDKFNINAKTSFTLQKIEKSDEIVERLLKIPLIGDDIDCNALSLFYSALEVIVEKLERCPEGAGDERVELIKRSILKNPTLSIPEIAKICNISEPYLYPIFKRVVGMTPNEYRQKALCERAIRLLSTTDMSVEEVSSSLGFSSSSYFRKVFFKHMGMTPREAKHITL